jgi:hypothetical protein
MANAGLNSPRPSACHQASGAAWYDERGRPFVVDSRSSGIQRGALRQAVDKSQRQLGGIVAIDAGRIHTAFHVGVGIGSLDLASTDRRPQAEQQVVLRGCPMRESAQPGRQLDHARVIACRDSDVLAVDADKVNGPPA